MEHKQATQNWVDDRLAILTPDWQPDLRHAHARLSARQTVRERPRRLSMAAALTACALCIALVALPGTRAVAQRLWDRLFLSGVTVVQLDPDRLPLSLSIHVGQSSPVTAETPEAAARYAGFTPALPPDFGRPAKLAVIGPITATANLSTQQLQQALDKARAHDVRAPHSWDGLKLGIEVSPIVVANFADDSTLMQLRPIALQTPAGFPVNDFVEIAFRILGLDAAEARKMAAQFAAHPSWILGVPQEDAVQMREVTLQSGPGMLIEDFTDEGEYERTTLIWSTADRTFVLSGNMTRDRAVAIANTVPSIN